MKIITLSQVDILTPVKVLVRNIKLFYSLTYNTGQTVTVIEFIDGSTFHYSNSISEIEDLIES
jgi:hypothetical protein